MSDPSNWFGEYIKTRVIQLRQSRGRRLAGTARRGDVTGAKKVVFPVGGKTEAYKLTGAIQKVRPGNPARTRVEVDIEDYEASLWVYRQDLNKMGPNEREQAAMEVAMAISRQEDNIQWDATKAYAVALAGASNLVTGGANNVSPSPLYTNAAKARLRGMGDNGQYMLFCPLPEMAMEQMKLWKQFATAEWIGNNDLPMRSMADMQARMYNGVVYFTLPDEYFTDANGNHIGKGGTATDYYTYMWASDSIGVESQWDESVPTVTQHAEYEGSPYLVKAGIGGAAVGLLPEGIARLQFQKQTALTDPHASA